MEIIAPLTVAAILGALWYLVRLGRRAQARDAVRTAPTPRSPDPTLTLTVTPQLLADARRAREDVWKRRVAFRQLPPGERGEGTVVRGRPIGFWIDQLRARSLMARTEAAGALREAGLSAYEALPLLWEQVKHREREVAEAAVYAIKDITCDPDEYKKACDLEDRRWHR